jgi:hypothetical protein
MATIEMLTQSRIGIQRAATPIPVLRDVIEQSLTFSAVYLSGLEMLAI